eukprot:Amastigsp_a841555_73.p2 type:complete len:196 gc:universal Amastigsp_a841555_73:835-1422(+)
MYGEPSVAHALAPDHEVTAEPPMIMPCSAGTLKTAWICDAGMYLAYICWSLAIVPGFTTVSLVPEKRNVRPLASDAGFASSPAANAAATAASSSVSETSSGSSMHSNASVSEPRAQNQGPPATMPAPTSSSANEKWNWTAAKAPDERPDTETRLGSPFRLEGKDCAAATTNTAARTRRGRFIIGRMNVRSPCTLR